MKYNLIFAFLFCTLSVVAQDQEAMKKIESARIALITERLSLTPEQAEKFWPLYREYTQQRQALRKEFQSLRRSSDDRQLTDEESKEVLQKGHNLKERQLDLDKTYTDKLGTVITNNQILLLRKAEDDFKQMIIKRLENRKENRERMERRIERKSNDQ
jgi:hypothetical protein